MSPQVLLFMAGAALALTGSLAADLSYRRLVRSRAQHPSLENVRRVTILLLMLPFNPFILLGKTLALGYRTKTGLLYLILQSCWYVTLVALLREAGWVLAGFGIGLHFAAILLGWEFYFKEDW